MYQMVSVLEGRNGPGRSFISKLKWLKDSRDKRGKRHELDFVLGSVVLAIMSGRSYVSSIYRFIKNRLSWLQRVLNAPQGKGVSRAQLPRILAGVDWKMLNRLIWSHFGVKIEMKGKEWIAIDGKTLRGVSGQQERILVAVEHETRQTVAQEPMQGSKRSEITAVREMLGQTGLEKGKSTLDALHFNPTTLQQIAQAQGQYVVQLKANQATLFDQMSQYAATTLPLGQLKSIEKGHGRLDSRQAIFFDIRSLSLDPRWADSGLSTLIVVARRSTTLAQQKVSAEVSFYLSNIPLQMGDLETQQVLFTAIRQHWGVEANNYIRDVSFAEDASHTKDPQQGQILASLRTLAIELFRQAHLSNFRAALDDFADNLDLFEAFLKQVRFL